MVRCETLESAAVTADCVTSEVAASERQRERERASGLEMQFLPVCTVLVQCRPML